MQKTTNSASKFISGYRNMASGLALHDIVKKLETFAPLSYAEKWDNVGLLLEPCESKPIEKILLTNDLTERVMKEAVEKNANMIISYHPPIFMPLNRITQKSWKERIVSICLSKQIALYSPHTTWDVALGGVNDWLARALPRENIQPINPLSDDENIGAGRIFSTSISLDNAIKAVQKHIGIDVHVALGVNHNLDTRIENVAVCAGAGGSVLRDIEADLYITGEMAHHEVLNANHNNVTVIMCNHSNSERGFLAEFQSKLEVMLEDGCEVMISEMDVDPIKTFVKDSKN